MIREIITDVGTFGSFKDLVKHMEIEKLDSIKIKVIRNWDGSYFDRLTGMYSFSEMKQVIK